METPNLNTCAGNKALDMFNLPANWLQTPSLRLPDVTQQEAITYLQGEFITQRLTDAEFTVSMIELGKTPEEQLFLSGQAAGYITLRLVGVV